jgi:hypothetical protein
MTNFCKIITRTLIGIAIYFCILNPISVQSQTNSDYIENQYYQKIAEAQYAYLKGNFKQTYSILSDLDKRIKLVNMPQFYELYRYAQLSSQYENYQKAYDCIFELISTYGFQLDDFANFPNFSEMKQRLKWDSLQLILQQEEQNFVADTALYNEFTQMFEQDQQAYILDSIDNLSYQKLLYIFETKGFPLSSSNKFTPLQQNEIYGKLIVLVIHQYDSAKMAYLKSTLMQYIRQGDCPPEFLAVLVDRSLLGTGNEIYGIYYDTPPDKIFDFENIDNRRREIGMPEYELEKKIRALQKERREKM